MSTKQVKKDTATRTKKVGAAEAIRSAHEDNVVQSLPFKNAKAREAAKILLQAVFGLLTESSQALEAKDLAVGVERQDDDPAREARDDAAAHLYALVTRTRPTLEAALGADASTRYGLFGGTPQQPDQLKIFAERVADLLTSDPEILTDLFGNTVDTAKIADLLRPAVQSLEAAIHNVKHEESQLDRALVERDTEAARLTRVSRASFLLLEGLFLLADQEAIFKKAANRTRAAEPTTTEPDPNEPPDNKPA